MLVNGIVQTWARVRRVSSFRLGTEWSMPSSARYRPTYSGDAGSPAGCASGITSHHLAAASRLLGAKAQTGTRRSMTTPLGKTYQAGPASGIASIGTIAELPEKWGTLSIVGTEESGNSFEEPGRHRTPSRVPRARSLRNWSVSRCQ